MPNGYVARGHCQVTQTGQKVLEERRLGCSAHEPQNVMRYDPKTTPAPPLFPSCGRDLRDHPTARAVNTSWKLTVTSEPFRYLHEGMQVEVVRGSLQGVRAILLRKEKRHRLVLGFRLIQQAAAAVEIDVRDVIPA